MPYISKAEREAERAAASQMMWSQVITHVRDVERCDQREARRQIGNAIEDGMLYVRWADERPYVWSFRGMQTIRTDEPSRDAVYWLECEADPSDPDCVLEQRFYDPTLVDKRTAARLDRKRRFRKPIFSREQVLALWLLMAESAQIPTGNVVHRLRRSRGRPTSKDLVYEILQKCARKDCL